MRDYFEPSRRDRTAHSISILAPSSSTMSTAQELKENKGNTEDGHGKIGVSWSRLSGTVEEVINVDDDASDANTAPEKQDVLSEQNQTHSSSPSPPLPPLHAEVGMDCTEYDLFAAVHHIGIMGEDPGSS